MKVLKIDIRSGTVTPHFHLSELIPKYVASAQHQIHSYYAKKKDIQMLIVVFHLNVEATNKKKKQKKTIW